MTKEAYIWAITKSDRNTGCNRISRPQNIQSNPSNLSGGKTPQPRPTILSGNSHSELKYLEILSNSVSNILD